MCSSSLDKLKHVRTQASELVDAFLSRGGVELETDDEFEADYLADSAIGNVTRLLAIIERRDNVCKTTVEECRNKSSKLVMQNSVYLEKFEAAITNKPNGFNFLNESTRISDDQ